MLLVLVFIYPAQREQTPALITLSPFHLCIVISHASKPRHSKSTFFSVSQSTPSNLPIPSLCMRPQETGAGVRHDPVSSTTTCSHICFWFSPKKASVLTVAFSHLLPLSLPLTSLPSDGNPLCQLCCWLCGRRRYSFITSPHSIRPFCRLWVFIFSVVPRSVALSLVWWCQV